MAKKKLDSPYKIKTPLEELEVMARLKETVEWTILKRWIVRYINNLMKASFKLMESDSNLSVRHAEFAGQALGLKMMIRYVEKAGIKLEDEEKKKEKKNG